MFILLSVVIFSGCITSAETVMLEKQSLDEFLSSINKGKTVVVSISPQSRASLAAHFGLSPLQVDIFLDFFWQHLYFFPGMHAMQNMFGILTTWPWMIIVTTFVQFNLLETVFLWFKYRMLVFVLILVLELPSDQGGKTVRKW